MRRFFALTIVVAAALATVLLASQPSVTTAGSLVLAAPMLQPRSGHSATLLPDGRVLIAGGMRRNQDFYRSAELYDPASGKFLPTGDMSLARVGHLAVLLPSGKVLIAGGWVMGGGTTDSAELYDPATGRFSVIAGMTTRRARPTATILKNGDILIAGGADHDGRGASTASAELFDPSKLSFHRTGSMHVARVSHTATLLDDGRVLMAGGYGDRVTPSAELFDPSTGRFTQTGNLLTARYKHTAGLLRDGKVLIAGGSDERDWQGQFSSAEIYDVRAGRFTAASSLNDARFKLPDEAVPLPSGRLLIAGGSTQVEIYDPLSGRFLLAAGRLENPWHFMSATRLKDGRVLLAGGYPNNPNATRQTWIYRP